MRLSNIFGFTAVILAATSCLENKFDSDLETQVAAERAALTIDPSIHVVNEPAGAPGTKSLIDRNTSVSINSNFLRLDETTAAGGQGTYTFPDWSTHGVVMEGRTASSPDDSEFGLRALTLIPTQTYRIKGEKVGTDKFRIDNYYHTRMVGWYPQTCELQTNSEGNKVTTGLDAARDASGNKIYSVEDGRVSIRFSKLGIDKDLMMTDLVEGQQWHEANSNQASDYVGGTTSGESIYRQPFGHYEGTPSYSNFFTFRHYRSAVRLYAEADQSDQNLAMWGTILGVRIINQPTACTIRIPQNVGEFADYDNGDIVWDENSLDDFDIMTDAMFEGNPDKTGLNNTVEYPLQLDGATSASRVYLGYALVQPDHPVEVELLTTSGIYSITLKNEYNGNSVLKAGSYYNITMSLQTTGAITEVLESRDDEVYYDLSKEWTLEENASTSGLRYANCYVVDPKSSMVATALADFNAKSELNKTRYDGFAFCATVIGNGEIGLIPSNRFHTSTTNIEPYSARLIWETSRGLVTNVELIHGYVRFKVKYTGTGNTTEKGNAVIGVYDKNNKLIWSWHIWVTDTPSEVEMSGYTFLDRNLGATVARPGNAAEALQSYGLYYQWGRKDPTMYPPTSDYPIKSLLTSSYYNYASQEINSSEVRQNVSPSLEDAVKYPQYIILPTSGTGGNYSYNWMYDNLTNLWGYSGGTVTKTIYDPCPFGYRVSGNELKEAADAIRGSATKNGYGWVSGNFVLPYTGYKGEDKNSNSLTCAWEDVGLRGDYQTARVSESTGSMFHRERVLISKTQTWNHWIGDTQNTYNNYYSADHTNRRTAAPVRCVKDGNMAGVITTTITISSAKSAQTLVAGDVLTIRYSASTTGNTSLNSVSLSITKDYEGSNQSTVLDTRTSGMGSNYNGSYTYTIENKETLAHILEGGYTFTVTASNNIGRRASSNAQLQRKVYRLTGLTPENMTVSTGRSKSLTTVTEPADLPENTIQFTSSNTAVATVDASGSVRGVSVGNAVITASVATTDEYTGMGTFTSNITVEEYTGPSIKFWFGEDWYAGETTNGMILGNTTELVWYVHYNNLSTLNRDVHRSQLTVNGATLYGYATGLIDISGEQYVRYKSTYYYANDQVAVFQPDRLGDFEVIFTATDGNETETDTKQIHVRNSIIYVKMIQGSWYGGNNGKITAYIYCENNDYPATAQCKINGNTANVQYELARPDLTKTNTTKVIDGLTYYAYEGNWKRNILTFLITSIKAETIIYNPREVHSEVVTYSF